MPRGFKKRLSGSLQADLKTPQPDVQQRGLGEKTGQHHHMTRMHAMLKY